MYSFRKGNKISYVGENDLNFAHFVASKRCTSEGFNPPKILCSHVPWKDKTWNSTECQYDHPVTVITKPSMKKWEEKTQVWKSPRRLIKREDWDALSAFVQELLKDEVEIVEE
jgi:hypothetical protein